MLHIKPLSVLQFITQFSLEPDKAARSSAHSMQINAPININALDVVTVWPYFIYKLTRRQLHKFFYDESGYNISLNSLTLVTPNIFVKC